MVALAATLLVGCGDDDPRASGDDAPWRTSSAPVETTGLVWASSSTVHLSDGTTIETGGAVRAFVVAGDGVFFVRAEGESDSSAFTGANLWFAAPGDEPVETGLTVASERVAVSPDGARLAVLDADLDDGSAVMRMFNLASGGETTSEDGMDTSGVDDPVDHLLETEVEILGIDADTVWARVIEGDYAYDLATGEGRPAEAPVGNGGDPLVSPDGTWRIEKPATGTDRVVGSDGSQVDLVVDEPRWNLSWWADAETAVGTVITGPGTGKRTEPGDTVQLLSCSVPSGECAAHPESAGEKVTFPIGATVSGIVLQDEQG